jgi:hypothetical protein
MRPSRCHPNARLLSLRAAEQESGLPKDTLRKLIATGVLSVVEIPHVRRVWIDRQDLHALIDAAKVSRPS